MNIRDVGCERTILAPASLGAAPAVSKLVQSARLVEYNVKSIALADTVRNTDYCQNCVDGPHGKEV